MRELKQKQKFRRKLYSLPVVVVLLLVAGVFVRGAIILLGKQMESATYVKELEDTSASLALRVTELEAGIENLATEEGIIREIREKFSVTAEGEYMAILIDEPAREVESEEIEEKRFRRWLKFIKNLWQ